MSTLGWIHIIHDEGKFYFSRMLSKGEKKPDAKKLYSLELMSTAYITSWKKEKWIALAVSLF